MSNAHLIPRPHWARYLKALSRRYLDQPVEVGVAPSGGPEAPMVHGLYFMGASLAGGEEDGLTLQMAQLGRPEAHFTHRIGEPLALAREVDDLGQLTLVVEGADRVTTSLSFRDAEPSPGRRRLAMPRAAARCDHPRCLLVPTLGPPRG